MLGNGGTETGPTRGYVSAYDSDNGDLAWRFYIVPGNPKDGFENSAMEMAAETLKVISRTGAVLYEHILIYDALYGETRKISIQKRSDCPVCGKAS